MQVLGCTRGQLRVKEELKCSQCPSCCMRTFYTSQENMIWTNGAPVGTFILGVQCKLQERGILFPLYSVPVLSVNTGSHGQSLINICGKNEFLVFGTVFGQLEVPGNPNFFKWSIILVNLVQDFAHAYAYKLNIFGSLEKCFKQRHVSMQVVCSSGQGFGPWTWAGSI